jgi:hypothetical protein
VELGQFPEALGRLVRGVLAAGVEERRALDDDVLGDNDAVAGGRVDVGVDAPQGAQAGAVGDIAVEARLRLPGVPERPACLGEVALAAQVRREPVGYATRALDAEAGVRRDS